MNILVASTVEYFKEATMEDSYIFGVFNNNKEVTTKMLSFLKSSVLIDKSYIQEQLIQIERTRISPLASAVLTAYERGDIELRFSKNVNTPTAIPYIVRQSKSTQLNPTGIIATVFISNFSGLTKDGNALNIPMKNLYVLMESAYIALYIHKHPMVLERSSGLMKICNLIYTEMFMRILNKEYALSITKDLYDRTAFFISKFFLENVWELKSKSIIDNTAMSVVLSPDRADLSNALVAYDQANIRSINELINFIKGMSPRMNDLNLKYFIQRYLNTYHGGSIMAIDYLPYLFYVIINTLLGAFLMSQTTLSDIIKNVKGIQGFYPELTRMVH